MAGEDDMLAFLWYECMKEDYCYCMCAYNIKNIFRDIENFEMMNYTIFS